MKITIKNIIKENKDIDPKQRYINGILNMIKPPYFNFLKVNEIPRELWKDILDNIFNTKVTYSNNRIYDSNDNNIYDEDYEGFWSKSEYDTNNNQIYYEDSNGFWSKREFDSNSNNIYRENSDGDWIKREYDSSNNQIYFENSDGRWTKSEYDENNNNIYYENSDGRWIKREYDENNNNIYYEHSDGRWIKREYDSNNNEIYQESSDGYWEKREYDSSNNQIYSEDSDGDWEKREYDSNNNEIYYENSNGQIMDNRSSNSLNENIDLKQIYINGILNMIRRPYMEFLINNEVPEELWKDILTKIFNTNDISWEKRIRDNKVYYELIIQDEKGKQLYYETHDYWEQLIYGYHTRLDMDFTWYINNSGIKKVTFIGKHNPVVYSNGPTGYSWSGLSDDIKNNKFFDLNY